MMTLSCDAASARASAVGFAPPDPCRRRNSVRRATRRERFTVEDHPRVSEPRIRRRNSTRRATAASTLCRRIRTAARHLVSNRRCDSLSAVCCDFCDAASACCVTAPQRRKMTPATDQDRPDVRRQQPERRRSRLKARARRDAPPHVADLAGVRPKRRAPLACIHPARSIASHADDLKPAA
jgi:hypothetical protein